MKWRFLARKTGFTHHLADDKPKVDDVKISDRTAKLKRNLIIFSILLMGVVIFGVKATQPDVYGVKFVGPDTSTLALLLWFVCSYHYLAMLFSMLADLSSVVSSLSTTDQPTNQTRDLLFPWLKSGGPVDWNTTITESWKISFRDEHSNNLDRAALRNFWVIDFAVPFLFMMLATLVATVFLFREAAPGLVRLIMLIGTS